MRTPEGNSPDYKYDMGGIAAVAVVLSIVSLLTIPGCSSDTKIEQEPSRAIASEAPVEAETKVEVPESAWQYSKSVDDLSGKSVYGASVKSSNFQSFDFPYSGDTYGTLSLRKHPRYGKDLIFQIDRGQILCHSYSGCPISIRFDNGSVIKVEGNAPADNSSDTVFLPYNRFIKKIKKSKKIVIGVPVYQEGEPAFTFETKSLEWKE